MRAGLDVLPAGTRSFADNRRRTDLLVEDEKKPVAIDADRAGFNFALLFTKPPVGSVLRLHDLALIVESVKSFDLVHLASLGPR
jgi:hypothetical protein